MLKQKRILVLVASVFSCVAAVVGRAEEPKRQTETTSLAVVARVEQHVQPLIDRELAEAQAKTAAELKNASRFPAHFKTPVHAKTMNDPWAGMAELERSGLAIATAGAGDSQQIAALLNEMSVALGKPPGDVETARPELPGSIDAHLAYIKALLARAKSLRDEAIEKIPVEKRAFMHSWPETMTRHFSPQFSFNEQTHPILQNDRAFCTFIDRQTDWSKMVRAAQVLAQLGEPAYLESLAATLDSAKPFDDGSKGLEGPILLKQETPHGLILFGGSGDNVYHLQQPVALLIDLGGNDTYRGLLAASHDADHPHSVLIDLAGNDKYEGKTLGLATGRLGVGLLVDAGGDDQYRLARGTGGAGFGGIGVLCDRSGNDVYAGTKFTQGVAIAGLGLLYDRAGDDQHTSHGYALGLGGPLGVGAVVDRAGDDSYQCGKQFPSGYNQLDAPDGKPGDPKYQWDAFGIGMGLGRRIFSQERAHHDYALAGGIGTLIDHNGDDQYESSNFSQACGYYFGVGLKLDLAGADKHAAARYGHASGAHMGMGLFVDYSGPDHYASSGPTYNGGCAWDHSAFLCIDAGTSGDRYDFGRSSGLGRANIGAWSTFAELGGDDVYIAPAPGGWVSKDGLAAFFDAGGTDNYDGIKNPGEVKPSDGRLSAQATGALFVDR